MENTALLWIMTALLGIMTAFLATDFIRIWAQSPIKRTDGPAGHSAPAESRTRSHRTGKKSRAHMGEKAVSNLDTGKHPAGIDLMSKPRPVFAAKLPPDGRVLHLLPPTKATADRFVEIGGLMQKLSRGRLELKEMEELFALAAMALNNNREGVACTASFVAERCSTNDVIDILTGYMNWLSEQVYSKN